MARRAEERQKAFKAACLAKYPALVLFDLALDAAPATTRCLFRGEKIIHPNGVTADDRYPDGASEISPDEIEALLELVPLVKYAEKEQPGFFPVSANIFVTWDATVFGKSVIHVDGGRVFDPHTGSDPEWMFLERALDERVTLAPTYVESASKAASKTQPITDQIFLTPEQIKEFSK